MRIIHFGKLAQETAEDFTLKNCNVVIDGQNYFHYKYQRSRLHFTFGGDIDRYATYMCDRELNMFRRANVKCYFVFKGGNTDINKKIKKFGRFTPSEGFLRPILSRDADVQIVHDMGFHHAFCITESKDDCVALATRLGCPLITTEVAYCFKAAPYIAETTLKFNWRTNTIECRRYTLQNFLERCKLTENKMAIFGALSDTDIFPSYFFNTLLESWNVLSAEEDVKHKQLILWLSNHKETEIRQRISEYLTSEDDRNKFWAAYECIRQSMQNTKGGYATDYLMNSRLNIGIRDADWFQKGVVCKRVPSMYVNLFKWQVIQGSWFDREDNNNDDSFLLSIDITKYAYNLLTNYKRSTLKLYHDSENYTEVDTLDPSVPRPGYDCEVSVFENGWEGINRWNLFQHFLENKDINIEMLSDLPEDCVLLFISLVYFARRKGDVTKEATAIIVCYVLLNRHRLLGNILSVNDLEEANRVTVKYFRILDDETKEIYDGQTMKSFDEFQFCLQQMNYLNTLCGSPYTETCYSKVYNGTFVYKLFTALNRSLLPTNEFMADLLRWAPSVLKYVNELIRKYEALLSTE